MITTCDGDTAHRPGPVNLSVSTDMGHLGRMTSFSIPPLRGDNAGDTDGADSTDSTDSTGHVGEGERA